MIHFDHADFKGTCDVCNTKNKVMYSINPHWETGEADAYCCAKCKNRLLKEDAKMDEYNNYYEHENKLKQSNNRSPFQPFS